jgi:predicted nucleotide-binding protein
MSTSFSAHVYTSGSAKTRELPNARVLIINVEDAEISIFFPSDISGVRLCEVRDSLNSIFAKIERDTKSLKVATDLKARGQ